MGIDHHNPVSGAPVVHVVDDDLAAQNAISRILRNAGYNVRVYPTAAEFLLARPGDRPGCALLDMRMLGPGGLKLQPALSSLTQALPIIFLTSNNDVPNTVRVIKAGAINVLTKPISRKALLQAVDDALAHNLHDRIVRQQLQTWNSSYRSLSARERQVFDGVVGGKLNKEIAAELGTAERTVKAHRAHVMQKMRARSVAELVHIAGQLQIDKTPTAPLSRPSR